MANLFSEIGLDVRAHARGERGGQSLIVVFLFSRGVHVLAMYRIQRLLIGVPIIGKFLAKILWYASTTLSGCDISYHADISGGACLPHPLGIVIGQAKIETDVTILQGVTIGKRTKNDREGPIVRRGAFIGAGAKLLGSVSVGRRSTVGANAVVVCDIPDFSVAVGVPATIKLQSLGGTTT